MMDELLNVFLDDLPWLPPDWEIKFYIDLVLGAQPASITLYSGN